jgi:CDP-diacylglycerol---glycerol-3-phosphate 3-phosphatidyltransferase
MIAITVFLLNWPPLEILAYALLYTAEEKSGCA